MIIMKKCIHIKYKQKSVILFQKVLYKLNLMLYTDVTSQKQKVKKGEI